MQGYLINLPFPIDSRRGSFLPHSPNFKSAPWRIIVQGVVGMYPQYTFQLHPTSWQHLSQHPASVPVIVPRAMDRQS